MKNLLNMTPEQITNQWILDNFNIDTERQQIEEKFPLGYIVSNEEFNTGMVEEHVFIEHLKNLIAANAAKQMSSIPRAVPPGGTYYLSMKYRDSYISHDGWDTMEVFIEGEYRCTRDETDEEVVNRLKKNIRGKIRAHKNAEKRKEKLAKEKAQAEKQERELFAKLKKKYENDGRGAGR